jgi:hypothetical protein
MSGNVRDLSRDTTEAPQPSVRSRELMSEDT